MSVDKMFLREPTLFELALLKGEASGLEGMDGSGNDWEFSQNIGSVAVEHELLDSTEEMM